VLAVLLLRMNAMVSIEVLIESLWPDYPPGAARGTLHTHVMRLRRVLGPVAGARIRTCGARYVMDVGDEELDAAKFSALASRGAVALRQQRWQDAASDLGVAQALWRGDPLADLPLNGWPLDEAARLGELRWLAAEDKIDAELQLGRHPQIIAELRGLVGAHPFRERLHGQLMRALYASGRKAEALETYRTIRGVLVEELGIEPGAELRQLHEAVLADDRARAGLPSEPVAVSAPPAGSPSPVGHPGPPGPSQLPADIAGFSGRGAQIGEIISFLTAGSCPPQQEPPHSPRVVVLTGAGGIGNPHSPFT
jgi:DNA-binding SARP family transcriptional activator